MSSLTALDQLLRDAASTPELSMEQLKSTVIPLLKQLHDVEINDACRQALFGVIEVLRSAVELDDKKKIAVKKTEENKVLQESRGAKRNRSPSTSDTEQLDGFSDSRRQAIEHTIVTDRNSLPKLEDIVGLHEAKQALTEALVDPLFYPDWFNNGSDLKPWRCVLLYGPPGTGKSHLAQAIAREIPSTFYLVSSSDLISSWSGQSEKLIRELFDHAIRGVKPSIIFVDEIDSLCRQRNAKEDDGNRRVKTELLVQLQRLQRVTGKQTLLVCATNCPWDLDAAFLRRFEKRIYVGLPNKQDRIQLMKRLLIKTPLDVSVDWEVMAERTEGSSGDDLRCLARELAFHQFRKFKRSGASALDRKRPPLTKADCDRVLSTFVPTVSKELLRQFEHFASAKE